MSDVQGHAEDTLQPPWGITDTWVGVLFLFIWIAASLGAVRLMEALDIENELLIIFMEAALLLPVLAQMVRKGIGWDRLGFRKFSLQDMGLGCGLLLMAYFVIAAHNLLLTLLDIPLQTEFLMEYIEVSQSAWGLIVASIVLAPLVEEIFFRGFIYSSLRKKFNWIAAGAISSGIFALFHLMPVVFIPTFVLGFVFSYLYERTHSLWPGILLHLLVNTLGISVVYAMVYLGSQT
ncbi:MAG: CPBP family intramembrane metalloprotease [Anaerolineales bacterium]|nr:CPBP family intramembrane metalloprotease [Anaerolineales bacterium]